MNSIEKTESVASSDNSSTATSIFFRSIGDLAESSGQSIADTLATERNAALSSGGLTDDCLLPDEVDNILTSETLMYREGQLGSVPDKHLSADDAAALDHVKGCGFCQSLLRIAQPHVGERAKFLEFVRSEAARASRGGIPTVNGHGELAPSSGGVLPRTVYWPIAVPVLLAASAALFAATPRSAFTETYASGWPAIVVAGLVGALLGRYGLRAAEALTPNRRHHISHRMRSTGPVLGMSIGAFIAMIALGGAATYRTDRAVLNAQAEAVKSAAEALSKSNRPNGQKQPVADFRPCATTSIAGETRYCSEVDGGLGNMVLELSAQRAGIYWEARGQRVREIELALARIRKGSDGSTNVKLPAGGESPLSESRAASYRDGESVIAIAHSPAVVRLANNLPDLDESAGQFALMRTSLPVGK